MPSARKPIDAFAVLPDPGQAGTLDAVVEQLRLLKIWAGNPSYAWIKDRVNTAWTAAGRPAHELVGKTTVVDCFRPGRRRLNIDLVIAVVKALHPDIGYMTQWRQALQVIGGESRAASQVRVQSSLPEDLDGFTGRTAELDQLRHALSRGRRDGAAAVIAAIAGMAGVGKTRLAVHTGHVVAQEMTFDRVLFVNLRGFHPDPSQPPADPAAVLDGFLRLLGVPGQQIPRELPVRIAAYRRRLAGTRTLVVLDNAADTEQVRPLLPKIPGCPVLVTSRRSLTDLPPAAHLTLDVFTPEEARVFLTRAAPQVPLGPDPGAPTRIVRRCGYLPLALGLVARHIRGTSGWTLTEHADRLDERHHDRRLDTGVQLALDLSYQHLAGDQQRLLRLAALHPGQDLDAYAAAALTDIDLPTARTRLHHLYCDHLLQQDAPGRYSFHDLVRAYATGRVTDEDPPSTRRAALTRLFDHYLATAAAAVDLLYPAEAHLRPRIFPPSTPTPVQLDPEAARAWLDIERPTLVAVATHAAAHGWPTHTTGLSATLFRYFDGGHHTDAVTVHAYAVHAAHHTGDPTGQAHALTSLGVAHQWLGRYGPAAEYLRQAVQLFRQAGDPTGQARALRDLGLLEQLLGHYERATHHIEQALALYRRHTGDRNGEAGALGILGYVYVRLGQYGKATEHLHTALTLCRQVGNRTDEAWTLDSLGTLHTRLEQSTQAAKHFRQAKAIFRQIDNRFGEASTLNGLGEAAHTAGLPAHALSHYTAAHIIAADIGTPEQHARAHNGLGHAHQTLNHPALARRHYQHALNLYTGLGTSDANQIRARLTAIEEAAANDND